LYAQSWYVADGGGSRQAAATSKRKASRFGLRIEPQLLAELEQAADDERGRPTSGPAGVQLGPGHLLRDQVRDETDEICSGGWHNWPVDR